jgi:RNA polymerase sigma-70 factor (ECF subfamily)
VVYEMVLLGWRGNGWGRRGVESEIAVSTPDRRGRLQGDRLDEGTSPSKVERAPAHEAEAPAVWLGELRPDVVRLCSRLLGTVDAEDAANEACLRAQARLASYDKTQPFRRWLLSVASHYCIDQLRRRSVEKHLFAPGAADLEALSGREPSVLDGLVRSESQAAVQAALDRLDERYRAPLVLRYMAELSYDAIGDELGLTRGQVATLLFRGKQRLRDLLDGEMGR